LSAFMILSVEHRREYEKQENKMEDRTIPRQTISVSLSLSDGRNLSGEIQIDLDMRLSDFINQPEKFIILKDRDNVLKLINKAHIVDIRLQ